MFEEELRSVLNKYSQENGSDTPDFILAAYLNRCLTVWNVTMSEREKWYGREKHAIGGNGVIPAPTK